MKSPEYIPYEPTAHVEVVENGYDKDFIGGVFPDATEQQIEVMVHHIKGRYHDGIEHGMALSDQDPIGPVEAYRMGEQDGFDRANIEHRARNNGGNE